MRISSLILYTMFAGAILFSPIDAFAAAKEQQDKQEKSSPSQEWRKKGPLHQAVPSASKPQQKSADKVKKANLNTKGEKAKAISNDGQKIKKTVHTQDVKGKKGILEHPSVDKEKKTAIESAEKTNHTYAYAEKHVPATEAWEISQRRMPEQSRLKSDTAVKWIHVPSSPVSIPKKSAEQQSPPVVISSLPQFSQKNTGSGSGGQGASPFRDKAWIMAVAVEMAVNLSLPIVSSEAWLTDQWVNAPPMEPPREASSFFKQENLF